MSKNTNAFNCHRITTDKSKSDKKSMEMNYEKKCNDRFKLFKMIEVNFALKSAMLLEILQTFLI